MKNQTPMKTEPGDGVIAPGACEISEIRPGPVRLAVQVEPGLQRAWLGGWETPSKAGEGFSRKSRLQELPGDEHGTLSPLNDL
jgi:hypothetical protein